MKTKYRVLIFLSLVITSLAIIGSTFIMNYVLSKNDQYISIDKNFNSDFIYTNNEYYIKFNTKNNEIKIKKYYLKISDDAYYLYNHTQHHFSNLNWKKYFNFDLNDNKISFNCLKTIKEIFEKELGNNGEIIINNSFNFKLDIHLNNFKYTENFNILSDKNKYIF